MASRSHVLKKADLLTLVVLAIAIAPVGIAIRPFAFFLVDLGLHDSSTLRLVLIFLAFGWMYVAGNVCFFWLLPRLRGTPNPKRFKICWSVGLFLGCFVWMATLDWFF